VIENVIIAKETKNNYSNIMSENVPTTTKIEIIILSIRRIIIDWMKKLEKVIPILVMWIILQINLKPQSFFTSMWHKKKLVARHVNIHAKNYYIQDHPLPKEGFRTLVSNMQVLELLRSSCTWMARKAWLIIRSKMWQSNVVKITMHTELKGGAHESIVNR